MITSGFLIVQILGGVVVVMTIW